MEDKELERILQKVRENAAKSDMDVDFSVDAEICGSAAPKQDTPCPKAGTAERAKLKAFFANWWKPGFWLRDADSHWREFRPNEYKRLQEDETLQKAVNDFLATMKRETDSGRMTEDLVLEVYGPMYIYKTPEPGSEYGYDTEYVDSEESTGTFPIW